MCRLPCAGLSVSDSVASWLQLEPQRPEQVPLRCWWARPTGTPPRGGVLVLPEVFGINGWIRSVTQRLAEVGYAALAVPLYARTAPALELGYGPADLALGRHHKELTRADQLLSDVGLAADWLQQQLPVPAAGLGCVGFCFGGHVALLAASLPQVAVTVDFYGAGVASGRPGGGPASLEQVPSIGGTLLCICGDGDPLIPPADVAAIKTALSAANAARVLAAVPPQPHRLVLLEGGHGFMCSARPDHRPEAAELGWSLLLEAFDQVLGSQGGRGSA